MGTFASKLTIAAALLLLAGALNLQAQTAEHNPPVLIPRSPQMARNNVPGADSALAFLPDSPAILPPPIQLVVERGVPLRVILKKSLPIQKVGQPIQAFVAERIYAFDRVVIPQGAEVLGHISELQPASKMKRARAYLSADFSPHRTFQMEFDTLVLKDGTRIPIRTKVMPDAGPVVHLEANPQKNGVTRRARGLVGSQWHELTAQLKPAALWRRANSFAWSEWPYHKQRLEAGTVFDAELKQPIDFGTAVIPAKEMGALGQLSATDDKTYARLATPLSSATARFGTLVTAILTRPVFSPAKKLLLPEGTEVHGMVVRAVPARKWHRNGQLHFILQRVQLPSGTPQPAEMALEGMKVAKSSHIELDSEGETRVASDRESRVLRTALSVAIANSTMHRDSEHGTVDPNGDPGTTAVAGGSGYKLIGFALGIGVQSRLFGQVMGFVGAGESAYFHFITRGNDLVLPRDTPIEISFGPRRQALEASR